MKQQDIVVKLHMDISEFQKQMKKVQRSLRHLNYQMHGRGRWNILLRDTWDWVGTFGQRWGFEPGAIRAAMVGSTLFCWGLALVLLLGNIVGWWSI